MLEACLSFKWNNLDGTLEKEVLNRASFFGLYIDRFEWCLFEKIGLIKEFEQKAFYEFYFCEAWLE